MFQFDYAGAYRQLAKLSEEAENLRALAEQLQGRNEDLSFQWEGSASAAYLNKADQLADSVTQAQLILEQCIAGLERAIERIRRTEEENEAKAQSL